MLWRPALILKCQRAMLRRRRARRNLTLVRVGTGSRGRGEEAAGKISPDDIVQTGAYMRGERDIVPCDELLLAR